jgi:signal peptidase I
VEKIGMMNEDNQVQQETFAGRAKDTADETARSFIIAALIALCIRAFLFEPFNIPSSSMEPGLLVGDFLFVSKYAYGYSSRSTLFGLLPFDGRIFFTEPKRGDVVVFKLPRDNHTDYIKRLIGLPGDRIQVRHGLLYINGEPVDRQKMDDYMAADYLTPPARAVDYRETSSDRAPYVVREEGDNRALDDTGVFIVPEGHYFFMGDNRDNSQDSRTVNVGFVPAENLVGRAERIFFSLGGDTRFWEIWRWPLEVRWHRLFMEIK